MKRKFLIWVKTLNSPSILIEDPSNETVERKEGFLLDGKGKGLRDGFRREIRIFRCITLKVVNVSFTHSERKDGTIVRCKYVNYTSGSLSGEVSCTFKNSLFSALNLLLLLIIDVSYVQHTEPSYLFLTLFVRILT